MVFIIADENAQVRLVLMHVEMVEPEPGHALTQLVRRIERMQDRARGRLLHPVVHRLLIDLLRGLFLIGIGNLIGTLGLRIERDQHVEGELVHVRHRLDLRLRWLGQRRIRCGVQLLVEPALDADGLQVRRA